MNRSERESAALGCELAGEVVSTFGEVCLRVSGTSMVPSIQPGDLISVHRANLSDISAGEIALYLREGRLFAHRVVARGGNPESPYLILRGDRHRHNDPPVSPSELLGRVQWIERGQRRLEAGARLGMWQRMIAMLLRSSNRATYLYLRVEARRRKFFTGRAECRV